MSDTHGPVAGAENSHEDQKRQLKHHATVAREYAKWSLLRGYQFTEPGISHLRELIREFFSLGTAVRLTERDMVLMLLGGLFEDS